MFTNPNLRDQNDNLPFNQPKQKHEPSSSSFPDSFILAKLLAEEKKNTGSGASALIITENQENAERISTEINFFNKDLNIKLFPDWEILPYEPFSPHEDLISNRLLSLYEAIKGNLDGIILSAQTALMRLPPKDFVAGHTFFLKKNQKIRIKGLINQLNIAGYANNTHVVSPREYSTRGNIIDLFPMGSLTPYRLELIDDEIETIKIFDPDTQRTLYPAEEIRILPSREFPIGKSSADRFRINWRKNFEGDPLKCTLYRDVGKEIFGSGIEYYLPFLHEKLDTIFSYLRNDGKVYEIGEIAQATEKQVIEINQRYDYLKHDIERPICPPESISIQQHQFNAAKKNFRNVDIYAISERFKVSQLPNLGIEGGINNDLDKFKVALENDKLGHSILVVTNNAGRAETIHSLMKKISIPSSVVGTFKEFETNSKKNKSSEVSISIVKGLLVHGFKIPEFSVITEFDLFQGLHHVSDKNDKRNERNVENFIKNLSELQIGSPVVHIDHGIGRYRGLKDVDIGEEANEFLHLEYANSANLYVPVSQLACINRYCGSDPENAPLHVLGSERWNKEKTKAVKQVRDTAAKLLGLYAKRAAKKGFSFQFNQSEFEEFSNGFEYIETTDQRAAIQAVVQDMISEKPMDRLICGDVGFGKTEVALRASFLAISSGKQVAILTPTTLLAEQHYQTFKDRFASFPVEICELSRFRKKSENIKSVLDIENGRIDIVVGTHKLITGNIKFKDLGLIIIDEEHRFGVRQKEKFREIRSEIDTIAMTATPIPRTLSMSMEGIRDFSIIASAPQKRLAIKTFVRHEDNFFVKEALIRELRRGGQAYVIHNEVRTINHKLEKLQKLVPEARIGIAHGQMAEKELEMVMRNFNQKKFNILLSSTIIETGIDIPSANTIIIYRADKFGLAQLHQLRGRVGRSHHQAYAYLLTPGQESLNKNAKKRLEAIQSMEELGSGFFLAMHDLEIRGAGEVLGENQSGNITEIGFSLYAEMLENAVRYLKEDKTGNFDLFNTPTIEVKLHVPSILPKNYCPDVNERLILYKKLAESHTELDLLKVEEELIDRFGLLPKEAKNLVLSHQIRIKAREIDLIKLDATEKSITIALNDNPKINVEHLLLKIQQKDSIKLIGENKIKFNLTSNNIDDYKRNIEEVFLTVSNKKISLGL